MTDEERGGRADNCGYYDKADNESNERDTEGQNTIINKGTELSGSVTSELYGMDDDLWRMFDEYTEEDSADTDKLA